ncbi:hypothetical protein PBAL39_19409 [Pedobacter sp. BAL39]|uniref:LutC/YkgG family protein n=1 Tax=Pedobacter sp. BAL39 TaxID=391596 RepID=UPI000155AC6B|nr:LUD domain-containing protein [Pedobacter sp. BAL39]EDM34145.1 hypothetical protein PBAL39_19409 [Pedobacter sp. BAL39]
MSSRAEILASLKANQPATRALPEDLENPVIFESPVSVFATMLTNIGGSAVEVSGFEEIKTYLKEHFSGLPRIISTLPELSDVTERDWIDHEPHSYENVDLAIIAAHFGVAENSALWITESLMQQRVIPFICQQLAVVVRKTDILSNMHQAYTRIADSSYGFGTFIAGPSKTADIEQSLVLGAHGPKNMTVFLVD